MGNQFLTDHLAAVGPISILNSDSNPTEKIDPLTYLYVRAQKYAHTRIADFGLYWPKCASGFFGGNFGIGIAVQSNSPIGIWSLLKGL